MRLIVLTGKARVGKTKALELLKKINDSSGIKRQQIYFQDDVRYEELDDFGLPLLERLPLGIIATNDRRVLSTINDNDIFVISQDREEQVKFLISNKEKELDWTEALYWLRDSSQTKPSNVDEFFNFVCK
jgi:hypothetical protein